MLVLASVRTTRECESSSNASDSTFEQVKQILSASESETGTDIQFRTRSRMQARAEAKGCDIAIYIQSGQ